MIIKNFLQKYFVMKKIFSERKNFSSHKKNLSLKIFLTKNNF